LVRAGLHRERVVPQRLQVGGDGRAPSEGAAGDESREASSGLLRDPGARAAGLSADHPLLRAVHHRHQQEDEGIRPAGHRPLDFQECDRRVDSGGAVPLLRYALRRIGQTVPVALLVTVLIFLLIKLLPGDPATAILGERASDAAVRALKEQWGLNRPLPVQYAVYMRNLATGNLGRSLRYRSPVIALLPRRIGLTLFLVLYSTILSLVIAVPLAIVAARNRDRWPDQLVRTLITIPLASPPFWIGLLLLILFALKLGWFPAAGYGEGFIGHVRHLFLPALTLSGFFAAVLTRNLRSALIDVQTTAYVDFAPPQGPDH